MPHLRRRDHALEDALNIVSDLLNITAAAADAIAVPALKLVVAILSDIIQRVKDVQTNCEAEAAFFEKTKALGDVIRKKIEEANTAPGGASAVLQGQIDVLSSSLEDIREAAGELKGGGGFLGDCRRLLFVKRNEATLDKMEKQLRNAQEMFMAEVQLTIQNVVGRVEQTVINAEERKIIDNIPHADASYLSVKEIKAGFMPGTRNETLGHLETWSGPGYPADAPKPLFLLTAGAGLGKSAVAHQLCVRLADRTQRGLNLGASFFFSRGDVDSAHLLFSTIARQLALTQPGLRPFIVEAARRFLDGGREQQMRHTFEQLLLKPLTVRSSGAVYQTTTFLIVDGLDECKDKDLIPDLLRCLLELVCCVPWLRVFLATRPEPHILPILTYQGAAEIVFHRRLDDPDAMEESRESVELYLRRAIPEIHPYGDFVRANPDQLDRLVDRADGLFVYARVAVHYLEMYDTHPEERLALLLESKGVRLSPLDKLYLQVLQSAFPSEDLAEWPAMQKRLHSFLTFIALHHMPLPPATISLLLTLTDDDVLWMAGRLRAVLLVDRDGNLVPLHATFSEFLIDNKRCVDSHYYIDPTKGNNFLALKCLAAFNHDATTLYLRNYDASHMGSHTSISNNQMSSWHWYQYIMCWDNHLDVAERSDELQQELCGMLKIQPIMTRLYDAGIRTQIIRIKKFLQDPEEAAAICSEYVGFRFYCDLWWRKMDGDCTASRSASVTVAELENCWESCIKDYDLEGVDNLSFSMRTEDIARYTAVLQKIVGNIQKSGMGELWYNLDIGFRDWPRM